MTGEKKHDDDPDFLDDDFVVEDIAGKGEDLDTLFDMPGKPKKGAPAGGPPSPADESPDDVLFTDHTKGLDPSFDATPQFAEGGDSTWTGEGLELEPNAQAKAKDAADNSSEEIDSQDEDFELDDQEQLEVVGAPEPEAAEAGDGIEQFENSGPFTVDDGEETNAGPLSSVGEPPQPGWEPLPETSMDALQEGADLARVEHSYEDAEGELVGAGVAGDGHDVVADADKLDRAARPIGPVHWETNRRGRLVASAAVLLLTLSGGAIVAFRPELVGLHLEPPRVELAKVLRPNVDIEVAVPKLPVSSSDPVAQVPTQSPVKPVTTDPNTTQPPVGPVAADPRKPDPVVPVTTDPQPQGPTNPGVPVVVVGPQPESGPWPVTPRQGAPGSQQSGLIRVSDDLKIGEHTFVPPPSSAAIQGVLPGSKAFAQLHNGNYFIGSVKGSDATSVTLKLVEEGGEITLQLDAIARLTEPGSADYAELQKVTAGFVRLTNNNRLVGGILSQIADDHVVLEFRKNRVMVPRSAIGALVQGNEDLTVRLDTTSEEDDWLRRLAERELGTGQPMMPPSTTTHRPTLPAQPRPPR